MFAIVLRTTADNKRYLRGDLVKHIRHDRTSYITFCRWGFLRLSSFRFPPQWYPKDTFKLYVNDVNFENLPDVTSQPRSALMASAATVTCDNCGNTGHYARGCAMPSNKTYDSDGEHARKDNAEVNKTKRAFTKAAGKLATEMLS